MILTLACMISCQNIVVQNKRLSFFVLFLWLVLAASGDIAYTVSYISVSPLYHSCTHVFDRVSSNCIISSQRSTDLESFFTRRLNYTSLLHSAAGFCRCHLLGDAWHSRLLCGSGPNEIIYKNDTGPTCCLWETMKILDNTWTTYLPNHSAILFFSLVSGNKESVTLTRWSHRITLS